MGDRPIKPIYFKIKKVVKLKHRLYVYIDHIFLEINRENRGNIFQ